MYIFLVLALINLPTDSLAQYRLPTHVQPSMYSLRIQPNIDEGTFQGKVSIRIKIASLCNSITLHSSNLTIKDVFLNQEKIGNFTIIEEYEFLKISPNQTIPPGNHIIHISFSGSLLGKNHLGFFKGEYLDDDGEVLSYLAVTDFQPVYTRRAFPCFDEPGFKSKFRLTLIAPNETFTAVSNMKINKKFETSYGVVYRFQTTPNMSPYLLAFAVTNYQRVEGEIVVGCRRIPVGFYSYNITEEIVENHLENIEQIMKFYTYYTGIPYPLPKLDFIEYDRDHSGATENWGLITCKRGIITEQDKYYDKASIINVLAHELAHFWFGDLVTNGWWNDIWLQEGFATFLALKAEENVLKNNATRVFAESNLDGIYLDDQKKSSFALVPTVENPLEIEELFSDLIYYKGSAVLAMLEGVLGDILDDIFRKYLRKFSYKTVTTDDFIDTIEHYVSRCDGDDANLRDFLESFLFQNRYPIINLQEEGGSYVLTQISSGFNRNDSESSFEYKWTIPITYITSSFPKKPRLIWFNKDLDKLTIPKRGETWIKLNYLQKGFYRTNYSNHLWNQLSLHYKELQHFEIEHVAAEAVQLYESDIISCEIFLEFVQKLQCKDVPRTYLYILWIHLTTGGLQLDEEAANIFRAFVLSYVPNVSQLLVDEVVQVQEERVKKCATWIKDNLRSYVKEGRPKCVAT